MFSRIAQRYDLTNTVISAGLDQYWRRCLARRVAGHAAQTILDVACGTGGVMMQVGRYCPATKHLIGGGFTPAMLHVWQRRQATAAQSYRLTPRSWVYLHLQQRETCCIFVTRQ